MAVGTYTLVETIAPDGYIKAESITFEVTENSEIQTVTMYDEQTSVIIYKQDAKTENNIVGAKLELVDKNGKVVSSWTTTNKGYSITGLPVGEYTLVEVSAPKGYLIAENIKIKIKEIAETQKFFMYDEKEPYTIKISKQDITTKKELPGATLELANEDGKVLYRWVSTSTPYEITGLEPGTYILTETIAPKVNIKNYGTNIGIFVKDDISGSVASGVNPEATKIYIVNQELGNNGYDSTTGEIDGVNITSLTNKDSSIDSSAGIYENGTEYLYDFKLNYNDPEIEKLIKGTFKIVVVAEDNVGNKSVTISDEFTPTIKINAKIVNTSIGSSESEIQSYKAGEDGKLIIRTTGYVNKLTIIFPKEIRDYNEELSNQIIITNPTPTYSQENTYEFSISLDTKQFKDYKDISIKAENEYGSTPANAKVYLNVTDKATDDIIDRIRNNN